MAHNKTVQNRGIKQEKSRPLFLRTIKVIGDNGEPLPSKVLRSRKILADKGFHRPIKARKVQTGIREFVQSLIH